MVERQDIRELVEALGETLTDGTISYDDEGRAAIAAGERVVIGIDHLEATNQILLHAELGQLPYGAPADGLMRDLLHESLELAAGLGGALAVDQESGTVALFARRSAEGIDVAVFETWVGDVAEAAEIWSERLARVEASTGEYSEP